MDASGNPARASRVRLLLLVAIAFVGYEYVLYRHWATSVPLVPTTTFEVPRDRVPIGFVGSGEFALAQRDSQLHPDSDSGLHHGAVEFRSFPDGNKLGERLTGFDSVATTFPVKSPVVHDEYGPRLSLIRHGRPIIAHHVSDSRRRSATFYCVDRDRFLCLSDGTLQSYDPNIDRVRWSLSLVQGVVMVDGDYAFVTRIREETPPGIRPKIYPVLLDIRDGSSNDQVFPEGGFELSDISPDGRLIVFLMSDAFEVWSIENRSRVWRKPSAEFGTRQLRFSNDSQRLVSWTLSEDGTFGSKSFQAADGGPMRAGLPADKERGSIYPSLAFAGSQYAFFHGIASTQRDSDLNRWLKNQAVRIGLFMTPANRQRVITVYEVDRQKFLGVLDATSEASLLTAPDGSGFTLFRQNWGKRSTLELYTLPPRSNWLWLAVRAIGIPIVIAAVAIGFSYWQRRRPIA
jgi:hypothetical protein